MTSVEDFILERQGKQNTILRYFHTLLTEEFQLTDKLKYKIPFYYGRSWICYLNPLKGGIVELAFTRGNELSNEQGLLISNGRKQICGIEIDSIIDAPVESIKEIIREAILLDEMEPYKSKRT